MSTRNSNTKTTRKYDFKQDLQPTPNPSLPNKKKKKYNFNQFEQEQNNIHDKLPNDTTDSLGNNTLTIQTNTALPQSFRQNTTVQQKKRANALKSQRGQPLIKRDDNTQTQLRTSPQQTRLIQRLGMNLLKGQWKQQLSDLIVKQPYRRQVRQICQKSITFLTLLNFKQQQIQIAFNKQTNQFQLEPSKQILLLNQKQYIREWLSMLIFGNYVESNQLKLDNLPVTMNYLASNKIQQLVHIFQTQQKYTQALILSHLQDELALQMTEWHPQPHQLQKQLQIINSQNVTVIARSSWPIQLGIAINYFFEQSFQQYLQSIYARYKKNCSFMFCQLLSLMLFYEDNTIIVREKDILNAINCEHRLKELELVFMLYTIIDHQGRFKIAIQHIVELLMKIIEDPELVIQIIRFVQPKAQKIGKYLQIYQTQNQHLQTDRQSKTIILQNYILKSFKSSNCPETTILHNWLICTTLLKYEQTNYYFQFLTYYIANSKQIKQSQIINPKDIEDSLMNILCNYQLCCNYKQQIRRKYYRILLQLQEIVSYGKCSKMTKGSIAFLQFKQGAFNLAEQNKFIYIYHLNSILKQRQEVEHNTKVNKFIRYVQQTITKRIINTNEGKIYITNLCSIESPQRKQLIVNHIRKGKQYLKDKEFGRGNLSQLLQLVDWDQTVKGNIVLQLLFC